MLSPEQSRVLDLWVEGRDHITEAARIGERIRLLEADMTPEEVAQVQAAAEAFATFQDQLNGAET